MQDARLALLESFGLEGYQARAYLALLDLGPAAAREVGARSSVPQGRIYDVLDKLHARGLVEVLPESPKRYRAVAFADFVGRELEGHRERVAALERDRGELVDALRRPEPPRAGGPGFAVVRGRPHVLERQVRLVEEALREVWVLGPEGSGHRLRRFEGALRGAVARGVDFRILLPVTQDNRARVEEARRWGASFRHHEPLAPPGPGAGFAVFDGDRALLFEYEPDEPPADARDAEASAVLFEGPAFARTLRGVFESLWSRAQELDERLRELDSGRPAGRVQVVRRLPEARPVIAEALGRVERELAFMAPADVVERELPHWLEVARALAPRGVRIRGVLDVASARDLETAARLRELGVELRFHSPLPLACGIWDDREAHLMVAELRRRAQRGEAAADMLLWCDGADFVASLAREFERTWGAALPNPPEPPPAEAPAPPRRGAPAQP